MSLSSTPLRTRLRQATRDALLDAAAVVFARQGVAVRIEDVAAEAGVAVGTVYNYFADRTELIQAVLESRTRGLLADLDAVVQSTESGASGFERGLTQFVEAMIQHVDANRVLITAIMDEQQQHGIDAKSVSRRESKLEQITSRAEQLMSKGLRSQVLRKGEAAVYAVLLLGMFRGLALGALAKQDPKLTPHATTIVEMFMKGAGR